MPEKILLFPQCEHTPHQPSMVVACPSRVWMPETNKIQVSCNVTFIEAERYVKNMKEDSVSDTSSCRHVNRTEPHQEEDEAEGNDDSVA
jgi:hypothetical protein